VLCLLERLVERVCFEGSEAIGLSLDVVVVCSGDRPRKVYFQVSCHARRHSPPQVYLTACRCSKGAYFVCHRYPTSTLTFMYILVTYLCLCMYIVVAIKSIPCILYSTVTPQRSESSDTGNAQTNCSPTFPLLPTHSYQTIEKFIS
jgi:hypothetical protein